MPAPAPFAANSPADAAPQPSVASAVRSFGRFELRRLLGKSAASMVWLAFDPTQRQEVMLTLPRLQPHDAASLARWSDAVRPVSRLDHPNLAPVLEIGVQDHWPFVATAREQRLTLGEWLSAHPHPAPADIAGWLADALRGLAFAHEAGSAHGDLQLHSLLVDSHGTVSVVGLCACGDALDAHPVGTADPPARDRRNDRAMAIDPQFLRGRREAATRDVLACGLLLHRLLTGQPPLEQPDTRLAMARMTPAGRELVRLPWTTPIPVPEALRAIANRCTASQDRLRYQAARTLLGALAGWRASNDQDGGGPVAVLLDRLQAVGHLPALPGLGARVSLLTSLEGQRTDEIAEQVLDDLALSFELLRTLNSAQVQNTQVAGNGPVLTLRRIIALLGVEGVRLAANTLRPWPGPLSPAQADQLKLTLARVRLAGYTAQALRPAGYDPQVVYLIAVLQNLGRLMLRYHFADEAEQVEQLMKPTPADHATDSREMPGLNEQAAVFAVLGVDLESLASAVARHWHLGADVLHMIRRLPGDAPVRAPDADADVLRITASAANDAVDAMASLPSTRLRPALERVAQRHAQALGLASKDVAEALQAGRDAMRKGLPLPAPRRAAVIDAAPSSAFAELAASAAPAL